MVHWLNSLRSSLGSSARMEKDGKRNTVGRRPNADRAERKKCHNLNFSCSRVVTDLDITEYLTEENRNFKH